MGRGLQFLVLFRPEAEGRGRFCTPFCPGLPWPVTGDVPFALHLFLSFVSPLARASAVHCPVTRYARSFASLNTNILTSDEGNPALAFGHLGPRTRSSTLSPSDFSGCALSPLLSVPVTNTRFKIISHFLLAEKKRGRKQRSQNWLQE